MEERLLTAAQVAEITTLSESEIGRRERAGNFPRRVKIGPKRTVWVASEVTAWIQETVKKIREETSNGNE